MGFGALGLGIGWNRFGVGAIQGYKAGLEIGFRVLFFNISRFSGNMRRFQIFPASQVIKLVLVPVFPGSQVMNIVCFPMFPGDRHCLFPICSASQVVNTNGFPIFAGSQGPNLVGS